VPFKYQAIAVPFGTGGHIPRCVARLMMATVTLSVTALLEFFSTRA
jgi:hypothetical protein